MTQLETHTEQIIMLAWSRILGLDDDGLQTAQPGIRVDAPDDDANAVTLVQLFGRTVLFGPSEVLAAARDGARRGACAWRPRCCTSAACDPPVHELWVRLISCSARSRHKIEGSDHVSISFDAEHVRQLTTQSPADDVARSGLEQARWTAAVGREDTASTVAAAGVEVWHQVLEHIGVLTDPLRASRTRTGALRRRCRR